MLTDFVLLRVDADFTSKDSGFRPICIQSSPDIDFTNQADIYFPTQSNSTIRLNKGQLGVKQDCNFDEPKNRTKSVTPKSKLTESAEFYCFQWNAPFDVAQPVEILKINETISHYIFKISDETFDTFSRVCQADR